LVGWIVARMAPRRIIPVIVYGNAFGLLPIILIPLCLIMNNASGSLLIEGLITNVLGIVTMGVAEVMVARYFVRLLKRPAK